MSWFDEVVEWVNTHRTALGSFTVFLAGLVAIFHQFFDYRLLELAIAVLAYIGSNLSSAGSSKSDEYHRTKMALRKEGLVDRRKRG